MSKTTRTLLLNVALPMYGGQAFSAILSGEFSLTGFAICTATLALISLMLDVMARRDARRRGYDSRGEP